MANAKGKDNFDLSELRGTAATLENKGIGGGNVENDDLNALSELVPDLKNRKATTTAVEAAIAIEQHNAHATAGQSGSVGGLAEVEIKLLPLPVDSSSNINYGSSNNNSNNNKDNNTTGGADHEQIVSLPTHHTAALTDSNANANKSNIITGSSARKDNIPFVGDDESSSDEFAPNDDDDDDDNFNVSVNVNVNDALYNGDDLSSDRALSTGSNQGNKSKHGDAHGGACITNNSNNMNNGNNKNNSNDNGNIGIGEFNNISSAQSLSTATQTHEIRMPMYLPTFKPATGCTNASDFIVRCFVARLRSGITVVKHGRSRWCKSRLRILHIHPDGRSLSWKPAQGEPHSSKRPPKLDLTTCEEVRHAWSPDPQNPMYTGTPILRQKCEAANAHKSFALIFPKRTVDITSVTADQCKVLMEGFSALCFRLQVANLAGKGSKKNTQKMPDEEDQLSTAASATLTNNSNQIASTTNNTTSPHNNRR